MNEQYKKNNRTILIIFAMSIIPFFIAWLLSLNTDWIKQGTNQGQLISPVVTTTLDEWIPFDTFSEQNIQQLQGHWVLVNVIPQQTCQEICQQAIHKTKQLRLMMNKDLTRIRRVVVMLSDIQAEIAVNWWKEDTRLLRVRAKATLQKKLITIIGSEIKDGVLLLMDPLGNLMMQYDTGFDPYAVKRDLGKLLRISQIG